MAGAWEQTPPQVLVAVLAGRDAVATKWAIHYRSMQLPPASDIHFLSGMPFDHARNTACDSTLKLGFQWCLRPDTLVETIDGPQEIKDIGIGDVVKTHLGRFKKVTEVYKTELKQGDPLLWIKSKNSTIKVTPKHPFYISRDGSARFVRAESMEVGDRLLYPISESDRNEDFLSFDITYNSIGRDGDGRAGSKGNAVALTTIPVDPDIARFLGLYLAEGCGGHDSIRLTFGNHESDLIEFVTAVSSKIFGRKPTIHKRWATTVKINIRKLSALFIGWFGKKATEKRIPEFVFEWSLKNRLSFLLGYLQGDGSIKGKYWSYRTSSSCLAEDVHRLAQSCGLVSKSVPVKASSSTISGHLVESKPSRHGWFSRKSVEKMMDLLDAEIDGDYLSMPIVSIEKHGLAASLIDPHVYNLEVEDDHSYIADVASVHNCFFLDDDVLIPPDTIPKLVSRGKPIISGLYYRRVPPIMPVALLDTKPKPTFIGNFNAGDVFEVDLVGAGCLLIHRSVLESMKWPWFDWRLDRFELPEDQKCSEDFAFCRDAKKLGHKIWLDTSVQCQHVGYGRSAIGGEYAPLTL